MAKNKKADLYFNGRFVGEIDSPLDFVADVRNKRRSGLISDQLNVSYAEEFDEIRINTDPGRSRRPLVIVENGKPKLTTEHIEKLAKGEIKWTDLIKTGIIEYVDAEEEENTYIAISPETVDKEHTHIEINPIALFGVSASTIPYPEYNRGDRINYGAKMVGQSIGLPAKNFITRTDTKFN
ncbi:MAG TPA: DNA-directed RNA polymerase subunit B, partial [archaeon]|nr:DNA-directed RNA polymerase subunit B [archaeon]